MSTVRSERATSEKPRAERSDTLGGVNNENALDALQGQKRRSVVLLFSRLVFLVKPYNRITAQPYISRFCAYSAPAYLYIILLSRGIALPRALRSLGFQPVEIL